MKVARVQSKTLLTKTLWYVWYDIHTHSALITNYWQLYRNAAFLMPFCIIRQVPSAQPLKPKYKHFWDSSPDVLLSYCTLYIQLISIHRGLGQCLKKKFHSHFSITAWWKSKRCWQSVVKLFQLQDLLYVSHPSLLRKGYLSHTYHLCDQIPTPT